MASKIFKKFLANAKSQDLYWEESTKLDFALGLERQRAKKAISYKELASRIQTSPAYITKVFRGDANLTIESMVKLARALESRLRISLEDDPDPSTWAKANASGGHPFYREPRNAWAGRPLKSPETC